MARQVSCTVKDRSQEIQAQIKSLGGMKKEGSGWVNWTKTLAAAISEIESGEQTYYVNIDGATPNLQVAVHKGVKYLKVAGEADAPTTLLRLPDC